MHVLCHILSGIPWNVIHETVIVRNYANSVLIHAIQDGMLSCIFLQFLKVYLNIVQVELNYT